MQQRSSSNVRGWLAMFLPALLPVTVLADPLTLQAPATQPPAAPVPVPGNPLIDPRLSTGKILILPFQPVNIADTNAWFGKSIQESLLADLTVMAPSRVASINQPAPTLDAAIAMGKQQGARFVIAGGFVISDRELRITGQIVDVETGQSIGALKATGEATQIFRMEDGLAMQIAGQLLPGQPQAAPQQPAPTPGPQQPSAILPAPAAPDATEQPVAPTPYAAPPTPTIYGADTNYPYTDTSAAYPYTYAPAHGYGYGYGYGYCPIGIGFSYYGRGYGGYGYRHYNTYGHVTNGYYGTLGLGTGGIRSGASIGVRSRSISVRSFGGSVGHASFGGFHGGGSFHGGGGGHGGGHR